MAIAIVLMAMLPLSPPLSILPAVVIGLWGCVMATAVTTPLMLATSRAKQIPWLLLALAGLRIFLAGTLAASIMGRDGQGVALAIFPASLQGAPVTALAFLLLYLGLTEITRRMAEPVGLAQQGALQPALYAIENELAQGMITMLDAREQREALLRDAGGPLMSSSVRFLAVGLAAGGLLLVGLTAAPHWPWLLAAAVVDGLGLVAYRVGWRSPAPSAEAVAPADAPPCFDEIADPETVMAMIGLPPLTLTLGLDLVELVVPEKGDDLMKCIVPMRVDLAMNTGFVMPGIRLHDDLNLRPNTYELRVRDRLVGKGELLLGYHLAVTQDTTDTSEELVGFEMSEPFFRKPAVWVTGAEADRARKLGHFVLDPKQTLIHHLDELVRGHAWEILSSEDWQVMLNKLAEKESAIVNGLRASRLEPIDQVTVIRALLRERVSIRNLTGIVELLVDHARRTQDPAALCELVRAGLSESLSASVADEHDTLYVLALAPGVEEAIATAFVQGPAGWVPAHGPRREDVVACLVDAHALASDKGYEPVILAPATVRARLRPLLGDALPHTTILAPHEVAPRYRIEVVGTVPPPERNAASAWGDFSG